MLVHPEASQQRETVYLPLALDKSAADADVLSHVAVVAEHHVVERVVLILNARCYDGWSKEQAAEVAGVHRSRHPCEVVGLAVCVRILLRSVVAVAVGVLYGRVERQLVLVTVEEHIIRKSAAVYHVFGLLGDVRLERFEVKLVASASELVGDMILYAQPAEL
ncbi:unknown [Prevotella sp. CAG:487]|nr:unknown [Prevotella sp. CAG:487]